MKSKYRICGFLQEFLKTDRQFVILILQVHFVSLYVFGNNNIIAFYMNSIHFIERTILPVPKDSRKDATS